MKEKIIEIVGFNMEPEKSELIAQQVLDLFAVSGSSASDIRNKLSPMKNLCQMLKNREVDPYMEIHDKMNELIDKEIEQCLINIEYLAAYDH